MSTKPVMPPSTNPILDSISNDLVIFLKDNEGNPGEKIVFKSPYDCKFTCEDTEKDMTPVFMMISINGKMCGMNTQGTVEIGLWVKDSTGAEHLFPLEDIFSFEENNLKLSFSGLLNKSC